MIAFREQGLLAVRAVLALVALLASNAAHGQEAMHQEDGDALASPVAVVADLSGKVWVHRAGAVAAVPATLGHRLRVGDELHSGKGATASVFLAGGQIIELLSKSRIRITKDLAAPKSSRPVARVSARSLKVLERGLWVMSAPGGSVLMGPMRGDGRPEPPSEAARLLSPRRETVPGSRPTFVWTGTPVPVAVVVAKGNGDIVHRATATASSWEIPRSTPSLSAGTYTWWVESVGSGERMAGPEEFHIAAHHAQEETSAFEEEMKDLEESAGSTLAAFLRCTYYEQIESWSHVVRLTGQFSHHPSHEVFARRTLRRSGERMGLDRASLDLLRASQGGGSGEGG